MAASLSAFIREDLARGVAKRRVGLGLEPGDSPESAARAKQKMTPEEIELGNSTETKILEV